jgi:hypothetical protein
LNFIKLLTEALLVLLKRAVLWRGNFTHLPTFDLCLREAAMQIDMTPESRPESGTYFSKSLAWNITLLKYAGNKRKSS